MDNSGEEYLRHYSEAKERLAKYRTSLFPNAINPYQHGSVSGGDFVIPEGVVDLADGCLRGSCIDNLFLPESLKTIGIAPMGEDWGKVGDGNVLAQCRIGCVVLPRNLEIIGQYAFAGCKIGSLTIWGKCLQSPYARQFKDSAIDTVIINTDGETSFGGSLSALAMGAFWGLDNHKGTLIVDGKPATFKELQSKIG